MLPKLKSGTYILVYSPVWKIFDPPIYIYIYTYIYIILHTIESVKANWLGYILRRNCLLKHVTEGKIDGTRRRGRRPEKLCMTFRKREDTGK
jgi:hypothetical protein